MNTLLARYTTREQYGIIFVSYQAFQSLTLFLCREGFRRAALRISDAKGKLAVAWAGVWFTLLVNFATSYHWAFYNVGDGAEDRNVGRDWSIPEFVF